MIFIAKQLETHMQDSMKKTILIRSLKISCRTTTLKANGIQHTKASVMIHFQYLDLPGQNARPKLSGQQYGGL